MNYVIQNLPLIELVTSELHPHLEFQTDNLDNLVNSIKKYGIIEPLLVRQKDGKYEIILGNRRYNAAKELGLATVPAIIVNVNDETALNMIITDNIQRKELSSKEEARLYDKALSLPNINKEQLSINLGIPLDRINSKLELIKKESFKQNNEQLTTEAQYLNENNSVNNDIINLSELNKEEKERDEFYMNNDQYMANNNMNNNLNNGAQDNGQQTPAFGGRFFPSMEDEPTNMNMTSNVSPLPGGNNQMEFSNNLNSSPLIDLTDTTQETPALEPAAVPEQNITNVEDKPTEAPTNLNTETEIPSIPNEVVNTQVDNTTPVAETKPSVDIPNTPDLKNIDATTNPIPTPVDIPQNPIPAATDVASPLPEGVIPTPTATDIPVVEPNPTPEILEPQMPNEPLNLDNIPNLNTLEPQINASDIVANIPQPNTEISEPTKDIIPVVNMIKNLAISIESLGYKLNITEDENNESYKINIEVEK